MCSILECIRNYFISTPEQIVIMIYYNHSSKEQWIILLVYWADSHLQKMSLHAAWTGQSAISWPLVTERDISPVNKEMNIPLFFTAMIIIKFVSNKPKICSVFIMYVVCGRYLLVSFILYFQKLFIYVLYQLQNISFVCSVYQTVLLAFQRYLAITQPLEYYANQSAAAAGKIGYI